MDRPATPPICPHHQEHSYEVCGYIEAVEGQPCGHVHDGSCGYVEAVPEVPCDMGCSDTDGDGVIDHVEGCAYTPALAGAPCQHEHDELCGYVEAVEGHPCGYVCRVCPVQAMIDALPDGLDITPDNRAEVEAQLEAIGEAWAGLSDEEAEQLDTSRCEAALEALAALDGQEDNDLPTALVEGDVSYLYCDENGQNWSTGTCASATEVTASDTAWGTANTTTWYVVSGEVTAPERIMVNGDVHLILADGCHLDARNGIGVLHNDNDAADVFANSLSIYAQSTGENMGRLTATSSDAAIGGQYRAELRPGGTRWDWDFFDHDAGKITIFGGNITATSSGNAASIGSGNDGQGGAYGSCGVITIHGGNVTAAGGHLGMGLGTNGRIGNVIITGGTVSAGRIGGNVTATGGTVSAETIQGAFSTGENGSAILHVNSFTDTSNQSDWDCLVYRGTVGKVYGDPVFTSDASLPPDKSLTVEAGCSLTVAQGATLTVPEGTVIINQGTIQSNGTLVNNGAINNSGAINGTINNTNGTIYQTTGATLPGNVGGTVIQDVQTYGDLLVAGGTHGTDYTYENNTLTVLTSTPLTITGNTTQDRIVVNANVNASLTLSSLRINFSASQSTESPLTICGSADVTLVGSSALYGRGYVDIGGYSGHAISVETNGSLTLKGSGSLSATGGHGKTAFQCNPSHGGAGIWNAGTLTIDGGQVELRGGTGGDEPNGFFAHGGAGVQGDVSISGGTVAITGGTGGSQITANPSGSGKGGIAVTGTLNMTGGTVSLRGGNRGSNNHGTSEQGGAAAGSVQISGGVLIATGGNDVKAITNEPTASGNCLVLANDTTDNSTRTGTVHGSIALQENFTLDEKDTLTIPTGSTLTINNGVTLTNSGTITNNGTIANSGTISGSGTITGDGTLTGNKATPTYTLPPGLTATYGQTIQNVALPNGWAWVNSSTSVGTVGTHQFSATFTPENTTFYGEVIKDLAIKVNRATLTPSATVENKTYDGKTTATGTISLSGAVNSESPAASGTFAFADANAGANKTVNVTGITLTDGWNANYQLSTTSITTTATITPKSIIGATVTLGDSLTYTGSEQTQTVSSVTINDLNATYTVSNNRQTDAGTYTLTVTGNGNFTGSQTKEFTIAQATNSITNLTCANIVFGGTPSPSYATATFGTVTYSYSNQQNGTYGAWNAANPVGTYYVKASVAGTDNYAEVEAKTSFQVTAQREVTPSASIEYGAETLTGLTASASYSITPAGGAAETVAASDSGTIIIQEGWFGKTLSIVKKAQSTDYSDSEAQSLPIPARPDAPATPLQLTKTADSITVTNSYPGCAFSIDGTTWSDTGAFTGLTAGTEYSVQVRFKATDSSFQSASMTQAVTTVAADGSATVKPGETAEIGVGTTVTNDGEKTTITTGGTTTTITPPAGGGDVNVGADGSIPLPGGSTVETGGTTTTVPEGGGTYYPDGTVTQDVCTVTFDSQGGSAVAPATVTYGNKVTKPTDPTKEGYTFNGWYHESECTTAFAFDTYVITSDVTLYAAWTKDHTHSYGPKWKSDADGHWQECECGEKSDQAAHTPGDWITDQEATTTIAGSKHKECTVCGYVTETEVIPATGSSSGRGSSTSTYAPTVEQPKEGGTVAVSPARPKKGDTVTITPKPEDGYEVDTIIVTDRSGKAVEVIKNPDGTYSFTQPSGRVKIETSYKVVKTLWNNPFADVAQGAWYYDAVEYAVTHDLFNGTSGTTFSPDATMTRAMLVTVLARLDGQDTEGGDTWYAKGMAWAVAQGISDGTTPNSPITREQLAAMLYRYAKAEKSSGNLTGFTDATSVSDWAKDALTWAVVNKIIHGKGGGVLDPKGQATRAEVAQMLKNFMTSEEVQA